MAIILKKTLGISNMKKKKQKTKTGIDPVMLHKWN